AVSGEQVFFGIGNGDFLKSADQPRGGVLCVRAADGQRLWRYDVADGVHSKPALDVEHVYFGCRDRHVYCVERTEGRLCWKQDLGSPVLASPALSAGKLIAAASGGRVACLAADSGQMVWN